MTEKVALVTGAARGIGLATAKLLAEEGRHVVLLDRDGNELDRAAATVPGALALHADVSIPEEAARAVAQREAAFGRLDILVNNAGIADFAPIPETGFARWREVMATNLDGTFLTSQAALPLLARRGGAIVNVASISGLRASTLRVAYGTSKAAVIHLTKQQAAELGELGIRASCVCPGPVNTKLALAVHTPAIRAAYHDAIPLNRYGSEREIAELIVFLAGEKAAYVTGQVVASDGGFEATGVGLPTLRRG